ncbi:hypothetical protein F6V25_07815 [Oryzomonas japonica]|uniref:Uncharacterized protein n=1 Tax=Oryzomonas japonica TaxID=2603858 RepID=A0A7J4ZSD2_9BACT|nr:hypothetical protein [Oryzomonas japonica]KAB0665619.1 hypothetical protein F6V25_07815 [Oryzomonas japonica]
MTSSPELLCRDATRHSVEYGWEEWTEGMGTDGHKHSWHTRLQARLYLGGAVILLAGLGISALVYLAAGDVSESAQTYEFEESKQSLRDLEVYGGTANVLAVEFMRWFGGLWHGRPLASTLACLTLLLSCGLFFIAYRWPFDRESDGRAEDKTDDAG